MHIAEFRGIVTGFNVTGQCIDCMCGKELINFEIDTSMKNAHKKMLDCVGLYKDMLITVSYPCSEIAFWNRDALGKIKVINTPLKLSGRAHIEKDFMYISSRNILGIDRISLIE